MQKKALGRGLNAILTEPTPQTASEAEIASPPETGKGPDTIASSNGAKAAPAMAVAEGSNSPAMAAAEESSFPLSIRAGRPVLELPLDRIRPNPRQPRRRFDPDKLTELALSVAQEGVLQPILLTRKGDHFEIIAGERRFRACVQAGRKTIPAILSESNEREGLKLALVENLLREDLNPIEEAHGFRVMVSEFEWTQDELADYLGRDRSTISNTLRLLQLPEVVQEMVARGSLSAGHVRALINLDETSCLDLAGHIERGRLSVRQAERLAKGRKSRPAPKRGGGQKLDPILSSLREKMESRFGLPVKLNYQEGSGRLEVHFHSDGELERIMQVLMISMDKDG
jgi:ParB family chromosome partitioning protein